MMTRRLQRTVAEAMLRHPTVHPAGLSVGEVAAAFEASPKTHLLLLVAGSRLVTTVSRADIRDARPEQPAADCGTLSERTVSQDAPLAAVQQLMAQRGCRRLAVLSDAGQLLGLLCAKRTFAGFCTDDGVAAMRTARLADLSIDPHPNI